MAGVVKVEQTLLQSFSEVGFLSLTKSLAQGKREKLLLFAHL
jgi:hypothetical protein